MNNDLISRSEVIEELKYLKHIGYDNSGVMKLQNMEIQRCISVIEDAPTVCGNNPKWCESCVSKGKCASTRPQGEWGKWVISEIQCPNCFEYFQTDCYSTEELKKCPNCGAQMIGGST